MGKNSMKENFRKKCIYKNCIMVESKDQLAYILVDLVLNTYFKYTKHQQYN